LVCVLILAWLRGVVGAAPNPAASPFYVGGTPRGGFTEPAMENIASSGNEKAFAGIGVAIIAVAAQSSPRTVQYPRGAFVVPVPTVSVIRWIATWPSWKR
jgi:hypothetical protein